MAVIIGFLAAGIFSGEFRPGTEDVFFATKYGRSKAIKNKIYCRNLRVNGYLLDRSRDIVSYLICSNGNEWIFHTVSD